MQQGWVSLLTAAQADSTALANTTTPTSILHPSAVITLPPNFLAIRSRLRLWLMGRISNIVTTPGTLTLDVRFGAVVVSAFGAIPLNVVAKTNVWWEAWIDLTVRAIGGGTAANVLATGSFCSESVIGSPAAAAGGVGIMPMPTSAPAVGTGFDETVAQAVNVFGTWSIANAGNSILTHQYDIESRN